MCACAARWCYSVQCSACDAAFPSPYTTPYQMTLWPCFFARPGLWVLTMKSLVLWLADGRTVGRPIHLSAVVVGVHRTSTAPAFTLWWLAYTEPAVEPALTHSVASYGVRVRSAGASRNQRTASQPANQPQVCSLYCTRYACVPVCLCAMTGFPPTRRASPTRHGSSRQEV